MGKSKKRPFAIAVLAWLYIVVGAVGSAGHYANFLKHRPATNEFVWITVLGAAAIVAGAFMLRGQNWARWLALAWMAAHVAISAFHPLPELVVHSALLVLISIVLFRRVARVYFSAA
jgi:hypothetical protein